ncbi:hypothetical protein [Nocardia sp. NPDC005366]|uniref:hypothetical protein n=1 Tax=Nocardia sp. NPDC005366 TaxID=3156878 RepID=UPI0033BB6F3E
MASPNWGNGPHLHGSDMYSGHNPTTRAAPPRGMGYPPPPASSHPATQPFTQPLPVPGAMYPHGHPQLPPIVIDNVGNSYATAAVHGYGYRRRQSLWVHFWLFCCTAGVGNVLYARYVSSWNRKRGL